MAAAPYQAYAQMSLHTSQNISQCQHRAMSKCLMAATPYQAYVIVPSQPSNLLCSVGRISVSAIRHFYPCKSRHFCHQSTPLLTP